MPHASPATSHTRHNRPLRLQRLCAALLEAREAERGAQDDARAFDRAAALLWEAAEAAAAPSGDALAFAADATAAQLLLMLAEVRGAAWSRMAVHGGAEGHWHCMLSPPPMMLLLFLSRAVNHAANHG